MKKSSHAILGKYLLEHYQPILSAPKRAAFLFGCVEPDWNLFTYLKGAVRDKHIKGHNYSNSVSLIRRLAFRLESKREMNLWDWYAMGKLNHYIADAFTFPHNEAFHGNLMDHNIYETVLQNTLIQNLKISNPQTKTKSHSAARMIMQLHKDYASAVSSPARDVYYIHLAECSVMAKITGQL